MPKTGTQLAEQDHKLAEGLGVDVTSKSPAPKVVKPTKPKKTNERSKERTTERAKIRHSFDIFRDQLLDLQEMQIKTIQQGKKKPKLGDLVQVALDEFFKKRIK